MINRLYIIVRDTKYWSWRAKESISQFFGLSGYASYWSARSRYYRKCKKLKITPSLFDVIDLD